MAERFIQIGNRTDNTEIMFIAHRAALRAAGLAVFLLVAGCLPNIERVDDLIIINYEARLNTYEDIRALAVKTCGGPVRLTTHTPSPFQNGFASHFVNFRCLAEPGAEKP